VSGWIHRAAAAGIQVQLATLARDHGITHFDHGVDQHIDLAEGILLRVVAYSAHI